MGIQTPNGFNLDNSGKRIVVDPVTRIEGHMRIEVNVDADNVIRNAVSTGTMWRGIEVILKNRDPRDAWAFTERICGVCTGSRIATSAIVPPASHTVMSISFRKARLIRTAPSEHRAVGFRWFNGTTIGIMVTPWFMNVVIPAGAIARDTSGPSLQIRAACLAARRRDCEALCDAAAGCASLRYARPPAWRRRPAPAGCLTRRRGCLVSVRCRVTRAKPQ